MEDLLPPYTELLLAYTRCLILKFLHSSKIFENPTIFDWIYADGFSIEYLTPAWAAKFTTLRNLYFSKIFFISLISSSEAFSKIKFVLVLFEISKSLFNLIV